ncbi:MULTISPECIES: hypothetical protein [unclassified Tardiphaga]|nr:MULTISPECIES: hypothetical protein [unclassified Tardiphaga]
MTKREIWILLGCTLLLGGFTLWGAIYAIDNYVFGQEVEEVFSYKR